MRPGERAPRPGEESALGVRYLDVHEKRRLHGGRLVLGSAIALALVGTATPAALAAYATGSVEPATWQQAGASAIAAKVRECVGLEGAAALFGCPAIDRVRAPEGTLVETQPVRARVTVTVTVQDPPPPPVEVPIPPAPRVLVPRPPAQPAPVPVTVARQPVVEPEHETGGHDD